MATRHTGGQSFDFGTRYLFGRSARFRSMLDAWQRAGLVAGWHPDLPEAALRHVRDSPLYKGVPEMMSVPKSLAAGLTVHLLKRVTAVRIANGAWSVETECGHYYMSQALVMTSPIPESLALLEEGGVALPTKILTELRSVEYASCLALMVHLDGPSGLPSEGAIALDGNPLTWIADHHLKGIASHPGAVTVYAGPEFSQQMLHEPAEAVTQAMLRAARPLLKAAVVSTQLHRWQYSQPVRTIQTSFMAALDNPPLILAGDAFGTGDCESAALSGIEAADYLNSTYCPSR
jgi:hypothetical protein